MQFEKAGFLEVEGHRLEKGDIKVREEVWRGLWRCTAWRRGWQGEELYILLRGLLCLAVMSKLQALIIPHILSSHSEIPGLEFHIGALLPSCEAPLSHLAPTPP